MIVRAHRALFTSPTCRKNVSFHRDGRHLLAIAGKFNSLKVNKKESKETLIPPRGVTPCCEESAGDNITTRNNSKNVNSPAANESSEQSTASDARNRSGCCARLNPKTSSEAPLVLQTRGRSLDVKSEQSPPLPKKIYI